MKSRVLSSMSAIGLAGILMLSAATPSLAEMPSSTPSVPESSSSGTGSLLFGGSGAAGRYESEEDRLAQEKLDSLRNVQTAEEVSAIANSSEPAVLLFDKKTGQYVAAYTVENAVGT